MKTLFLTAGDISTASSRIRAYWPARYMDDAECTPLTQLGEVLPDAENYIFQKAVHIDLMNWLLKKGKRVYWDICEPHHWFSPSLSREIADAATGVVACSSFLGEDFSEWWGKSVTVIPDRIDLSEYTHRREHTESTPVKFIWYGYSQNRFALLGALANLERLAANDYSISLTIYDDAAAGGWNITDMFPIRHLAWSLENENKVIASHDIAVLPPYPGPWGKVKSDNRSQVAEACGLPVTTGFDYRHLEQLVRDPAARRTQYSRHTDVLQSAQEWEALLCKS